MNFYISDVHFGHKNVIEFDQRPFQDVEEMDRIMIDKWNQKVKKDDHVYIIGDFIYKSEKAAVWYLEQLNGYLHLILGNHDRNWLIQPGVRDYFEEIEKMQYIKDERNLIQMCHYPIIEWNQYHRGSYLIYGHIHGKRDDTYEFMKTRERALNAAACINDYVPVTFHELVKNNQKFQRILS